MQQTLSTGQLPQPSLAPQPWGGRPKLTGISRAAGRQGGGWRLALIAAPQPIAH